MLGRTHDSADPGDQDPEARHAPGPAVGGDGPVDRLEQVPAIRLQRLRVILARRARPDARALQDVAVQRRVPADPPGRSSASRRWSQPISAAVASNRMRSGFIAQPTFWK